MGMKKYKDTGHLIKQQSYYMYWSILNPALSFGLELNS